MLGLILVQVRKLRPDICVFRLLIGPACYRFKRHIPQALTDPQARVGTFPPCFHHFVSAQYFGAIDHLFPYFDTDRIMARYSAYLGRRVEVHYRAGDILLPASGTFVADSGRSIFLEQHMVQRGQQQQFRWEIPYQYIVNVHLVPEPAVSRGVSQPDAAEEPEVHTAQEVHAVQQLERSASATDAARPASKPARPAAVEPALTPLQNRPKPA